MPVGERAAAADPQQQAAVALGLEGALLAPAGEPPFADVAGRDEREGAPGDSQGEEVAGGPVEAGGQERTVQRSGGVEVGEPARQKGVVRQCRGPCGRGCRGGPVEQDLPAGEQLPPGVGEPAREVGGEEGVDDDVDAGHRVAGVADQVLAGEVAVPQGARLPAVFDAVQDEHRLPRGDDGDVQARQAAVEPVLGIAVRF
ncbi:hypothetical protein [Streptomyces sp. DSM 40868]|uniref:hypothetical protein n=1 Tax=Streptomyces sp. DSM 40868 TaxID=2721173 RepID=UPI001FCBE5F5|nr:hypothetical protein [Streptomyces sp. DSM 40868]